MLLKAEELLARCLMLLCTFLVIGTLLSIIAVVVWRGAGAMSVEMLTRVPEGGFYLGKEGGILNAILGSLYIAGGATLLSFLFALPIALSLQKGYLGGRRAADLVRLVFDILFGIPSIVYGALGFALMIAVGISSSLLGGIIAVTLLELPMMVRGIDETLKAVPDPLLEASLSMGATRIETYLRVGLRQALPGIITAVILSFGRGIGDAASVLFTAGFSDNIPGPLLEPAATLPLGIFFQLGSPLPAVQERAYASAVVLLGIVLSLSVLTRILAARFDKYVLR